jgi:hypothetical protein
MDETATDAHGIFCRYRGNCRMTILRLDKARREEAKRKADKYCSRDGGAPQPNPDLDPLGEMSPADYSRCRAFLSATTGIPKTFLDEEYRERHKAYKEDGGLEDFMAEPDPWPDPVDGNVLLLEIVDAIKRHMVLPEGAAEVIALWAVFTHAHDCFEISPYLAITSPTPECGKTTLLTLLGCLVRRPVPASNLTGPAVFRAVDKWSPTLLIDEADTYLRDSDDLRGILNCGHHRHNAYILRCHGEHHDLRRFRTWAPKAIACIGTLPRRWSVAQSISSCKEDSSPNQSCLCVATGFLISPPFIARPHGG